MTRPVHLCGSVPLGSAREVFEAVGSTLGERAVRIPDGETGNRLDWLQWQTHYLRQCPQLEEVVVKSVYRGSQIQFRKRPEVPDSSLQIGPLGYSDVAIRSFAEFSALKKAGRLPSATRFMVALPTPLACVRVHIAEESKVPVEPAYELAMRNEIAAIAAAIPHDELAIQWDVAVEFSIIENRPAHFGNRVQEIIDRLAARVDEIPAQVSAGLHLCYGDSGHKHFKEPQDTAMLVQVANAVSAKARRSIDWIHLPVPRDRDDSAYFAPLGGMKLEPRTQLYLGLLHLTDGIEGAKRRIAAAQAHVGNFGIGTECGFGRRDANTIGRLLQLHREASEL